MTEWIELKTLQDVAKADAAEWEIELRDTYNKWCKWNGEIWNIHNQYRARPRQPKMETVKMECWIDDSGELRWVREWWSPKHDWIRTPALDIKIEIPEVKG